MPRTIDEVLEQKKTRTVDELLDRQVGERAVTRMDPGMLRGGVKTREYDVTTPGMVRRGLTAGAMLGAAAFTGGAPFWTGLLIEAGAGSATDFLGRAVGLRDEDEAEAFTPRGAASSAAVGATTLATGALLRGGQKTFAALGGVQKAGREAIGNKGPIAAYKFLQDAPPEAEASMATEAARYGSDFLNKRRPMVAMQMADGFIDYIDEVYAQNPLSRQTADITNFQMRRPVNPPERLTIRGRMEAEKPIPGIRQEGIVQTGKLRDYIISLKRKALGPPEVVSENTALDNLAADLPESMTLRDLVNYIRGMRSPAAEQIGKLTGASLNPGDRLRIANFASRVRDDILGEAGASMFDLGEAKLKAVRKFMRIIADNKGEVKINAGPAAFREILSPKRVLVRKAFLDFQNRTGLPIHDIAVELAERRQWDPQDLESANFISNLILRAVRKASRKVAEGISVLANPKYAPAAISPFISPDFGDVNRTVSPRHLSPGAQRILERSRGSR